MYFTYCGMLCVSDHPSFSPVLHFVIVRSFIRVFATLAEYQCLGVTIAVLEWIRVPHRTGIAIA